MNSASADRTNRRIAIVAFGMAMLLFAMIALLTRTPEGGDAITPPSTFYASNFGTRAIYMVTSRLLPSTQQWRQPLTELSGGNRTLIALQPQPLSEREAAALDRWINSGGQLILATGRTWDIENPRSNRDQKAKPGDYLGRHQIYRRPGEGARAVAASETRMVGKGRIVYVPDGFAFSNQTLRETDNAVWLVTRISEWGGVALFDEYHHGFALKRGFFSLVGAFLFTSPWGFACLQIALAGLVYLFGVRRRFGSIIEELPVERTSPLEAAEALGGLFQTGQSRALATRTIHQYVNLQLSTQAGRRVDLLDPESRERVARRSTLERADLDAYAAAVEAAMAKPGSTSDPQLVRLVRTATTISRSLSHGSDANRRPAAAG